LAYLAANEAVDIAYKLETMGEKEDMSGAPDTFMTLSKECEKLKDFIVHYK